MKQAYRMKQVIGKIAKQHNFDLMAGDGSSLKLENDPYMPLSICAYRPGRVAVNHQRQDDYSRDIEFDPEVQFIIVADFKLDGSTQWLPVTYEQPPMVINFAGQERVIGGFQEYVRIDEDGHLTHINTKRQADLASFCHTWANNIHDQGFDDPSQVKATVYK